MPTATHITASGVFQAEYVADTENHYGVPSEQWHRWSRIQRKLFNCVYSQMVDNQAHYRERDRTATDAQDWETTCFNAAWTAADGLEDVIDP